MPNEQKLGSLLQDKGFKKIEVIKKCQRRRFFSLIYYSNVKTMRKIAQIFVAFSEKLNFTPQRQPNSFVEI